MATRRKSSSKKQEEKVETPEQEVVKPKRSVKSASPKPSAKQVSKKEEQKVEEAAPQAQEPMPEPPVEEVKEPEPQPLQEKEAPPAPLPETEEAVSEPEVETQQLLQKKQLEVGATVMMPNGHLGVISSKYKNKFIVSSKTKPGKSYSHKASQLSLV